MNATDPRVIDITFALVDRGSLGWSILFQFNGKPYSLDFAADYAYDKAIEVTRRTIICSVPRGTVVILRRGKEWPGVKQNDNLGQ